MDETANFSVAHLTPLPARRRERRAGDMMTSASSRSLQDGKGSRTVERTYGNV